MQLDDEILYFKKSMPGFLPSLSFLSFNLSLSHFFFFLFFFFFFFFLSGIPLPIDEELDPTISKKERARELRPRKEAPLHH